MSDKNIIDYLDSMGQTRGGTSVKELISLGCNDDGSVKLAKYDENVGFHSINNPGWIKYELDNEYKISYIRLLLWDNCPGTPQLEAWISHACMEIFGEYPAFAYIKKK